ncbi:MAG: hypothetical protein KY433_11965, partial [Actinobacteria bacterium]|nr:hypothetical protein [Actinomycetota bacterium]
MDVDVDVAREAGPSAQRRQLLDELGGGGEQVAPALDALEHLAGLEAEQAGVAGAGADEGSVEAARAGLRTVRADLRGLVAPEAIDAAIAAYEREGRRLVQAARAVALVDAPLAPAQATRTWVSAVGDDVNPCNRTAPCRTFAGAISKMAAGGEIGVLDPGPYGAVAITKSITINGAGVIASILTSGGLNGVSVNNTSGAPITVVLRDIDIISPSTSPG